MNKKLKAFLITIIVLAILAIIVYEATNTTDMNNLGNDPNASSTPYSDNLTISTSGNSQVITTKASATIRVINEYDSSMFEGKKSILFMWASWCPNCATELDELQKILDYYKNTDYNIVFIAHEFENSIGDLVTLLETEHRYDTEVLLDLGRVIRKYFDPEAGTIPRTYFIDENCNVLGSIDSATTLEEVKGLVNTYFN